MKIVSEDNFLHTGYIIVSKIMKRYTNLLRVQIIAPFSETVYNYLTHI